MSASAWLLPSGLGGGGGGRDRALLELTDQYYTETKAEESARAIFTIHVTV